MNLYHFIRPATAVAVLAMGLASAAQAGPVSVTMTAKDRYAAFIGGADGSGLTGIGSWTGPGSSYTTPETYAGLNAPAGSYLYIMAWGIVGQEDPPGIQAVVTTINGDTVYTDSTLWQGIHRPQPYTGFGASSDVPPSDSILAAVIASADWEQDQVVEAPVNYFGNIVGGGLAHQIWVNSFFTNVNDGSYVMVRTALDSNGAPPASVSEPHSAALAALGLLAAWGGRRRSARA